MYGKMAYFSACYGVGKTRFFSRLGANEFFRSENREAYRMNKVGTCFF